MFKVPDFPAGDTDYWINHSVRDNNNAMAKCIARMDWMSRFSIGMLALGAKTQMAERFSPSGHCLPDYTQVF